MAGRAAPGLEDQEAPQQHVEEQDPIVEGSPTLHKVPSVTFLREEYVVVHTVQEEAPKEGRYANFPKSFSNPVSPFPCSDEVARFMVLVLVLLHMV